MFSNLPLVNRFHYICLENIFKAQKMTVEEYATTYLENEIRIIENSYRKNVLTQLNVFEKAIIYKYTEDGFDDLNESLRISKSEKINLFGKLLAECLDKLPDFIGTVFRSENLAKNEWEEYLLAFTNDSIITKHSFTSTSKSQLSANKFGIYRLEIFVQKGKDIEKNAKYDDEKEVIIRYNSNFRVVGIFNNFVQLIEI